MTIIAFDGRLVAADSLCCNGSTRAAKPAQKLRVRDGFVFALTGTAGLFEPMIEWYLAGKNPKDVPVCEDGDKKTSLVVFSPDGTGFGYSPGLPYPCPVHAPDAWGIGADFALGAMEFGANAREAVEVTIRREIYTGGPVQVIDLSEFARKADA